MKRKFTAVMPISAYPFHFGHADLFGRAEEIFGEGNVLILVCNNSSKNYFAYDRMRFFRNSRVFSAKYCDGLVSDYCQAHGIKFIVRGIRNAKDFDYEKTISVFNEIFGINTVFLSARSQFECYSSTIIRELLKYGKMTEAAAMCPILLKEDLEKLAKELKKNEK